tara:strand:- start:804 stop:1766 length:963 start_codon:yes stop_codon:yes gene_type:complete
MCSSVILLAYSLNLDPPSPQPLAPVSQSGLTCQYIGIEQAEQLLTAVLPDANILVAQPVTGDPSTDGCVTQVRLLADRGNPDSAGSVFVLPDGEHFFNGPLMDSSTRLTVGVKKQSDEGDELVSDMSSLEMLNKMYGLAQSIDQQNATPPNDSDTEQAGLSELMHDISSLPNQIIYNEQGDRTAFIVFDPSCSVCRGLFNDQAKILTEKNIKMVWVPTYLAPQTQALSAQVVKALGDSQEKAKSLMTLAMGTATDSANLDLLLGAPSPSDFAQLEKSAAYTRALLIDQKLGTPLIMFRSSMTNDIKLISGYGGPEDFAEL